MNRLVHRHIRWSVAAGAAALWLLRAGAATAAASGMGSGNLAATIDTKAYLNDLYIWMLGFVGIAALFAIVMGGVLYMFSGTNLTKVESAKRWIWNAVFGIILAAGGVLLLRIINPDFVTHGFDLNKMIDAVCQKYGSGCAVPPPKP